MTRRPAVAALAALALALELAAVPARAQAPPVPGPAGEDSSAAQAASESTVRTTIQRHLGRPYVWGSSGLKSYDCSGFVWRVMNENGILIKRTTARKYFLTLPRVSDDDRWAFGNIVFFSNLKHCGIVRTPETFYHAAVSAGTHVSRFDPMWRGKVSGVRAMPRLAGSEASAPAGH